MCPLVGHTHALEHTRARTRTLKIDPVVCSGQMGSTSACASIFKRRAFPGASTTVCHWHTHYRMRRAWRSCLFISRSYPHRSSPNPCPCMPRVQQKFAHSVRQARYVQQHVFLGRERHAELAVHLRRPAAARARARARLLINCRARACLIAAACVCPRIAPRTVAHASINFSGFSENCGTRVFRESERESGRRGRGGEGARETEHC